MTSGFAHTWAPGGDERLVSRSGSLNLCTVITPWKKKREWKICTPVKHTPFQIHFVYSVILLACMFIYCRSKSIFVKLITTMQGQDLFAIYLVFVGVGPLDCDTVWANVPPKRLSPPTSPHGVTTQKTNIDIFTAVTTSNIVFRQSSQY
jgi:hypothetical protein